MGTDKKNHAADFLTYKLLIQGEEVVGWRSTPKKWKTSKLIKIPLQFSIQI